MIRSILVFIAVSFSLGAQAFPGVDGASSPGIEQQRKALRAFKAVVGRHQVRCAESESDGDRSGKPVYSQNSWDNMDCDGNPVAPLELLINRTAGDVPPETVERVTAFFEHLRMNHWSEAAGHVSRLSEALPFNPALAGDSDGYPRVNTYRSLGDVGRAKLIRITENPGDVFGWPAEGKGVTVAGERVKGWKVTIPKINEESGWLVSFLEYDELYADTTIFYWIREQGEWRILCDDAYLRFLDFRPGHEIDPELGRTVTEFQTTYARAVNRSGFWGRSSSDYQKAYSFCTERYRRVRGYKSFIGDVDSGPEWNLSVAALTICSLSFNRIVGFRVEGDEVRVVTEGTIRIPFYSESDNDSSVWVRENGQWRRDRY